MTNHTFVLLNGCKFTFTSNYTNPMYALNEFIKSMCFISFDSNPETRIAVTFDTQQSITVGDLLNATTDQHNGQ